MSETERAMNNDTKKGQPERQKETRQDRNSARVKRGRGGGRAGEVRKDKYAKSCIRYKCTKRTKFSKYVGRLIFVHVYVCMHLCTRACMNG